MTQLDRSSLAAILWFLAGCVLMVIADQARPVTCLPAAVAFALSLVYKADELRRTE